MFLLNCHIHWWFYIIDWACNILGWLQILFVMTLYRLDLYHGQALISTTKPWAKLSTLEGAVCVQCCGTKLTNLELKTRPKQVLGQLLLNVCTSKMCSTLTFIYIYSKLKRLALVTAVILLFVRKTKSISIRKVPHNH
jgi:hypothetical protein